MTPQELLYFRELAGLDNQSVTEKNRDWADKQISKNQPIPVLTPLENFTMRLNGTLHPHTSQSPISEKKVEHRDHNLEGLANRLNTLLGSNNFKVTRLN